MSSEQTPPPRSADDLDESIKYLWSINGTLATDSNTAFERDDARLGNYLLNVAERVYFATVKLEAYKRNQETTQVTDGR